MENMNKRFITEKAERLYRDVMQAERELQSCLDRSMTLNDLEEIRSMQTEVSYRMSLFTQYIESQEVEKWIH